MTAEGRVLDKREADIATRTAELTGGQKQLEARAAALEADRRAWIRRIDPEFNVPARAALTPGTKTLRLTAKSFIKTIDLSSMSADARPRAERAFAWIANTNFSEDPATPSP